MTAEEEMHPICADLRDRESRDITRIDAEEFYRMLDDTGLFKQKLQEWRTSIISIDPMGTWGSAPYERLRRKTRGPLQLAIVSCAPRSDAHGGSIGLDVVDKATMVIDSHALGEPMC